MFPLSCVANRTELNEFGLQVLTSLKSASANRHDRRVDREVEQSLAVTDATKAGSNSTPSKSDSEPNKCQKEAIRMREEKRQKARN